MNHLYFYKLIFLLIESEHSQNTLSFIQMYPEMYLLLLQASVVFKSLVIFTLLFYKIIIYDSTFVFIFQMV